MFIQYFYLQLCPLQLEDDSYSSRPHELWKELHLRWPGVTSQVVFSNTCWTALTRETPKLPSKNKLELGAGPEMPCKTKERWNADA